MKETRPPLGNRVLENASTVGHRFDGSKDTRSRDSRQRHKHNARLRRVQTFLIREDADAALNQAALNCYAGRQCLASGDFGAARYLTRCAAAYARFAEGCIADIQGKAAASNIIQLRPLGVRSCAAFGTPSIAGGSIPEPSQLESELKALRADNAKAYAARSAWRVKS